LSATKPHRFNDTQQDLAPARLPERSRGFWLAFLASGSISQDQQQQKHNAAWDQKHHRYFGDGFPDLHCAFSPRLRVSSPEEITGMKHQRVSELGLDLARVEKYRDKLLGKQFVAAHLEDSHVRGQLGCQ
jgi:hypothetical protein